MHPDLRDTLIMACSDVIATNTVALDRARVALQHIAMCPDTVNFIVEATLIESNGVDIAGHETYTDKNLRNAMINANAALDVRYRELTESKDKEWLTLFSERAEADVDGGGPEIVYEVVCQAGPDVRIPVPVEHWQRWEYVPKRG